MNDNVLFLMCGFVIGVLVTRIAFIPLVNYINTTTKILNELLPYATEKIREDIKKMVGYDENTR